MDKMKFMKKKDKEEGMSDNERDAKMTAVSAMRDMAAKMMGDKLDSVKQKVTVGASDKAGLEAGLDKAKELVSAGPMNHESHDEEDPDMEDLEEDSHMDLDHDGEEGEAPDHVAKVLDKPPGFDPGADHEGMDEMSEDEINAKLEKLMALKDKLALKKV